MNAAYRRNLDMAALLGGQMCVGAAGLFGALTLGGTSGLTACALRMVLAALAVAPFAMFGPRAALARGDAARLAGAGAFLALHFALWIAALATLPVTVCALMISTSPMWGELWGLVGQRRRPEPMFAGVVVVTSVGLCMMLSGPRALADHPQAGLGILMGLGSGAAQAATLLCVESLHLARAAGGRPPLAVVSVVVRTYAWSAVLLAVAAWLDGGSLPPLSDHRTWAGVLAMAGVSQLVGHTLVNRAVARFPARLVILTALVRPAFAAILAALVLGERLSTRSLAGAALVAAGVTGALVMTSIRQAPAPVDPPDAPQA